MSPNNKHYKRLFQFYIKKGLSNKDSELYSKMKLEKLENFNSENSYHYNLRKLIPKLTNKKSPKIIDIGCGTGEYVILMRLLGFEAYGIDIYSDEIEIAKKLALDFGFNNKIFMKSLPGKKLKFKKNEFDLSSMFSVMEHLDNNIFPDLMIEALRISKLGLYSLVPNKYKFVDDHTRLPFLGFFSNFVIKNIILKIFNTNYKLSENGQWDVTLRSYSEIKDHFQKIGHDINLVDDNYIYPPLTLVPKIEIKKINSYKDILNNIHYLILKLFFNKKENFYPYLNLFVKK